MKNYLGMLNPELGSSLLHKAADGGGRIFDEAKIKRDKGGRFSSIEGRLLDEAFLNKLEDHIWDLDSTGKAMEEAGIQAMTALGLDPSRTLTDLTDAQGVDFDNAYAEAVLPYFNEQAKKHGGTPDGSAYVQYRFEGKDESGRLVSKPYVVKNGAGHSDLVHWGGLDKIWDESQAVRDEGGQFATKAASKAVDAAKFVNENAISETSTIRWKDPVTGELHEETEVDKTKLTDIAAGVLDKVLRVETKVTTHDPVLGTSTEVVDSRPMNWRNLFHSDLVTTIEAEEGDAVHYGVLGMKWGRRRTDAQIANDTLKRKATGEEVTPTQKAKAVVKGDETPASRYARLEVAAKSGGARSMSEEDLKFFNARTEALSKVNKLNQTNPSWLQATSKKVLQQAAQTAMQDVANGVTKKYITTPILDNLSTAVVQKK